MILYLWEVESCWRLGRGQYSVMPSLNILNRNAPTLLLVLSPISSLLQNVAPPVVVQGVVDRHEPLQGHSDGHVDGAHQRDGIQWVEDVGVDHDVIIRLKTKLPQRFEQHREQVDEVKDCQGGNELVERVSNAFTQEKEDGDGVPDNTKTTDDQLDDTLKDEAQKLKKEEVFLRSLFILNIKYHQLRFSHLTWGQV